jgi:hypothetical protein
LCFGRKHKQSGVFVNDSFSGYAFAMSNIPKDLPERFDAAIEAQQNHIRIARALVSQAVALIKGGTLDVDDLTKATAALEKGTKMETRANSELIKLTKERPRS